MRTSSVFQPTLPLRGATHEHGPGGQPQPASTHAPLAGSDVPRVELFRDLRVSTHAPLAGSDMPITSAAQPSPFCFNPRSPCGERRARRERRHLRGPVSTHAPLAGSDDAPDAQWDAGARVSTHAPLAGSDRCGDAPSTGARSFNPRSPCGERRPRGRRTCGRTCFNPRSPCGERPQGPRRDSSRPCFNPRSPCGERRSRRTCATSTCGFNPRSPCGERRQRVDELYRICREFQPTLPLRGATRGR